jgi:hypothetical protein
MSSMDQFLAEHYGTNKTASPAQEDLEKAASVELFLKLANEEGIDIKSMTDSQVQALYSNWATKAAEFPPKKEGEEPEEKEKEKVEEAKKEHEEKKAEAAKIAEADFLGRVMAHSYVQEMRKIAADAEGMPAPGTAKEGAVPAALRKGLDAVKGTAHDAAHNVHKFVDAARGQAKETGKATRLGMEARQHRGAIGTAAGVAGGAGATAAAMHHHEKKGSAIDELACERAVVMVHESGFDAEQAGRKIAAAFTLNLIEDSTKVASAADVATAVEIRALELLERVGYPVQWNQ